MTLHLETKKTQMAVTRQTPSYILLYTCVLFSIQFVLILSLSLHEYRNWSTSVWDFGFFAQALHQIANGEVNPISSYTGLPFLKDHFSLIMWPIAWMSQLFLGVKILFWVQAFSIAGTGLVISRILDAQVRRLDVPRSIAIGLSTCLPFVIFLYPWTYWGAAFDFHTDATAAFFVALAIWQVGRNRGKVSWFYFLWLVLALACKDNTAIIVMALGIILICLKELRVQGYITLCLGIVWFVITQVLFPTGISSSGQHVSHITQMYGYMGKSTSQILKTCIIHPMVPIRMLKSHLIYFLDAFGPLLFTSLVSIWGAIPAVFVVVLMNGLSSQTMVTSAQYYYLLLVEPMLFLGMGFSVIRMTRWLSARHTRFTRTFQWLPTTLVSIVALYWAFQWIPQLPTAKIRTPSTTASSLTEAANLIPSNAEVLTTNVIGEGLEPRDNEYLVRSGLVPLRGRYVYALLNPLVGIHSQSPAQQVSEFNILLHQPDASVVYQKNRVWLVRFPVSKKFITFPEVQGTSTRKYPAFLLPSDSGTPVFTANHDAFMETTGKEGYVVYGPYEPLLNGNYVAEADLAITGSKDSLVNVEVWDSRENALLVRQTLHGNSEHRVITLPFQLHSTEYHPYNVVQGSFGTWVLTVPPSQTGDPVEIRVWTNGQGKTRVYWTAINNRL